MPSRRTLYTAFYWIANFCKMAVHTFTFGQRKFKIISAKARVNQFKGMKNSTFMAKQQMF